MAPRAPSPARKRAPAHRWSAIECGSRCSVCGVEKRPERKPSKRIGKVFVFRYYLEGKDIGRTPPRCLSGHERQTDLLDPERFE